MFTQSMSEAHYFHWTRALEAQLFVSVGSPSTLRCPIVGDWAHASVSLRSDDFHDAVGESRNALSGYALQTYPRLWGKWNDELNRTFAEVDSIVAKSRQRLRKFGEDVVDDILIQRFTSMILCCMWLEEWFSVPIEHRVYNKCREIYAASHMVCGWNDGEYPDGEWVLW